MSGLTHRSLLAVVAVIGLVTLVGMAWLWPRGAAPVQDEEIIQSARLVDATLVAVELAGGDTPGLLPGATNVIVTARIEGPGETVAFEMTDDTGDTFQPGQKVRLSVVEQPGQEPTYFVSDFRRDRPLAVLGLLFVGAVLAFGRVHGLRALLGLGLTFVVIVQFILPAILAGRSPVAVALVGAGAIMIVTLYLSHGFSAKTTAAVVGTAGALALTGLLAVLFVTAASLTGFSSEEARLANLEVGGLSLQGLLLAGIIIGGLGVLDDVTMSQSSTVFELRRANPRASFGALVTGALNVGRDHVAATVNTLFLAYAGAALPLLILFSVGTDSFGTILTSEVVAVEVVRTLVGSLGLIAAVPLTSVLAAAVVERAAGGEAADEPPPDLEGPLVPGAGPLGAAGDGGEGPEWERRLRTAYGLSERPVPTRPPRPSRLPGPSGPAGPAAPAASEEDPAAD